MGELAHGTKTFFTKGLRRIGKGKMRLGMCLCVDNGYGDRARQRLEEAGVPRNWEEMTSSDSEPLGTAPFPPPPVFQGPDPVRGWLDDGSQFRSYLPRGQYGAPSTPSSSSAGQVRIQITTSFADLKFSLYLQ